MSYAIHYAHPRVLEEIQSWPPAMQADFAWLVDLLKEMGPRLRVPHAYAVAPAIFDVPVGGREGDGHVLCGRADDAVVLLEAFRGPSRPDRESYRITVAMRRLAKARRAAKGLQAARVDAEYAPVPHDHAAFMQAAQAHEGFDAAYAALKDGHLIARTFVAARVRAGLSQVEIARRMGTSASAVSRLEAVDGGPSPSLSTLRRYADAVGCDLEVVLTPHPSPRAPAVSRPPASRPAPQP